MKKSGYVFSADPCSITDPAVAHAKLATRAAKAVASVLPVLALALAALHPTRTKRTLAAAARPAALAKVAASALLALALALAALRLSRARTLAAAARLAVPVKVAASVHPAHALAPAAPLPLRLIRAASELPSDLPESSLTSQLLWRVLVPRWSMQVRFMPFQGAVIALRETERSVVPSTLPS